MQLQLTFPGYFLKWRIWFSRASTAVAKERRERASLDRGFKNYIIFQHVVKSALSKPV